MTGGQITGTVSQTDGSGKADLDIPFFGAYAFARNGGFVFDMSVRRDLINAEFTIAQAGLLKTSVGGAATTLAAYSSYTIELKGNFALTPYAGVSWSSTELDSFNINNPGATPTVAGRVNPGTNDTSMGRIGVQLSYAQQLSKTFYLQPFAGVSLWDAFQSDTSLNYTYTDGSSVKVATQSPKDFVQVDGGLSFAATSIQATGFVKGIYKDGDNIKGESIVLGGRLNF